MRILLLLLLASCAHGVTPLHGDQPDRGKMDGYEDRSKGAIKTWNTGEGLRSQDLNSNFSHIHNLMVGGHGARLVDADVSASAAITHSKMAVPALIPKAWMMFTTSCGAAPCTETMNASSQVSTLSKLATGQWRVTWTTARTDAYYFIILSVIASADRVCGVFVQTTTTADIYCFIANTGVATDTLWGLTLMDNT